MVADMTSANEAEDVSTAARPPKLRTFDLTLMDHPRLGAALSYCRCSYQIVLGAILCDHGLRGPDALSDSDVGWTRSRSSGPLRGGLLGVREIRFHPGVAYVYNQRKAFSRSNAPWDLLHPSSSRGGSHPDSGKLRRGKRVALRQSFRSVPRSEE